MYHNQPHDQPHIKFDVPTTTIAVCFTMKRSHDIKYAILPPLTKEPLLHATSALTIQFIALRCGIFVILFHFPFFFIAHHQPDSQFARPYCQKVWKLCNNNNNKDLTEDQSNVKNCRRYIACTQVPNQLSKEREIF